MKTGVLSFNEQNYLISDPLGRAKEFNIIFSFVIDNLRQSMDSPHTLRSLQ